MILGTGASPGIAMGKVLLLQNQELIIEKKIISDVEAEKTRFLNALDASKDELSQIKDKALKELDTILTMTTSGEIEKYIEKTFRI